MAVERPGATPTMLDQAADRFREGLAAGRTPARINIERSLNQVDGYLASPLDDDPFATLAGPEDWDGRGLAGRAGRARPRRSPPGLRPLPRRAARRAAARRPPRRPRRPVPPRRRRRAVPGADRDPHRPAADRRGAPRHRPGGGRPARAGGVRRRSAAGCSAPRTWPRSSTACATTPTCATRDGDEILADARALPRRRHGGHGRLVRHPARRRRACSRRCPTSSPPTRRRRTTRPRPPTAAGPASTTSTCTTPPAEAGPRRRRSRSTRPSPAITSSWPSPPSGPTCPRSAGCRGATPRSSRAGPSTPSGWPTRWACTRRDLDRLGMLATDSWRACRLVVDTGLHALGWTRQQAIDFMVGQRARSPRGDRGRGRPLHRHARPGAGLQGRPARDPAAAGRGPGRAGRRLRHRRASTTPCSAAPRSACRCCGTGSRRGPGLGASGSTKSGPTSVSP